MFSRDLCPKKGRHISRADLCLSLFNFHGILISVLLPFLIPASVLPDKPAVRCHAVREHDSSSSVGKRIKVIPLSVNQNPARLHTGVDIDIEPVSVNRIKDPSGSQIAIRIKSHPQMLSDRTAHSVYIGLPPFRSRLLFLILPSPLSCHHKTFFLIYRTFHQLKYLTLFYIFFICQSIDLERIDLQQERIVAICCSQIRSPKY